MKLKSQSSVIILSVLPSIARFNLILISLCYLTNVVFLFKSVHPPPGNSFCFFLTTTSFSVPLFNNFDILAFTYSLLHPRREKLHP